MSDLAIERSNRSPETVQSLKRGDFVALHFNPAIEKGFIGFIVQAKDRVRLRVHQPVGDKLQDECLKWDIVVPMEAIAFIRHLSWKLKSCDCREGL